MATSAGWSRPADRAGREHQAGRGTALLRTGSVTTSCPDRGRTAEPITGAPPAPSLMLEKATDRLLQVDGRKGPAQKRVDASFERFFASAVMGTEGDDRNPAELGLGLELGKDLETVFDAEREVEQHQGDVPVLQRVQRGAKPGRPG